MPSRETLETREVGPCKSHEVQQGQVQGLASWLRAIPNMDTG